MQHLSVQKRAKQVMRPEHAKWHKFLKRLEGPEGCNFTETEKGITWRCQGGRDKSLATAIMRRFPDVDLERSIDYFEKNGGYCDCEILFNLGGKNDIT